MATFERFEDIEAWIQARELCRDIFELTRQAAFRRDFALRDQMRRACVSAMSNIAEGFERDGNKEFAHFLSMAKGSVGEVRSQLYVALDSSLVDQASFDSLCQKATRTSRLIAGLMMYLNNSTRRGRKFRRRHQE